jgi:hypothetical protein
LISISHLSVEGHIVGRVGLCDGGDDVPERCDQGLAVGAAGAYPLSATGYRRMDVK